MSPFSPLVSRQNMLKSLTLSSQILFSQTFYPFFLAVLWTHSNLSVLSNMFCPQQNVIIQLRPNQCQKEQNNYLAFLHAKLLLILLHAMLFCFYKQHCWILICCGVCCNPILHSISCLTLSFFSWSLNCCVKLLAYSASFWLFMIISLIR